MKQPKIQYIRSVTIGAPQATQHQIFYEKAWGLIPVLVEQDKLYFRATGSEHYILCVQDTQKRGLLSIQFAVESIKEVDDLYEILKQKRISIISSPSLLNTPGKGYGFSFRDPDGHCIEVSSDVTFLPKIENTLLPYKLSHVALNTPKIDLLKDFYVDVLDFRISDWSENKIVFLRCNQDHHSISLFENTSPSLNHAAFEIPSLEAFMKNMGRMQQCGYPVNWGPGCHGPGNNPFAYYIEPNGFVFEYTTGLQQIDEKAHHPLIWEITPQSWDVWALSGPPSPEIRAAMAGV